MIKRTALASLLSLPALAALAPGLAGCANDVAPDDTVDAADDASVLEGGVIVGALDWVDAAGLRADSVERKASRAVAYVSIPQAQARCSGFLIGPDVLMTNHHCVPGASFAVQARAHFVYERAGVDEGVHVCDEFIGADEGLDYALLRCKGRPGDTYGFLALDDAANGEGDRIQLFHQQCDYFTDATCEPTKKMSPGKILGTIGNSIITHDADMLGGSSGGAIVAAGTTRVVALNNAHFVTTTNGRGTTNLGVPMSRVLPHIRDNFPVALGDDVACPAIPTAGRVVDEDDGCVTLGGDARFLRSVEDAGHDGDLIWTGTTANTSASNFATWSLRFETAGRYEVAVAVHATLATATTAPYAIRHAGVVDTVSISQAAGDGFVVLGTFNFAAGGGQSVRLGDNTGVARQQVVFDAVRVRPAPAASPAPACARVQITAATLNVRRQPSTQQASVGSLARGEIVTRTATVVGEAVRGTTTWYRVEKPGLNGYVSAAYAACVP